MDFIFTILRRILGSNINITNIVLGLLSISFVFFGLKYYFTTNQETIEKQRNEINNLKTEKHIQENIFIKKEFELNQSNRINNIKQRIRDLDRQQYIKTANSTEDNKTKININTIKDIEKLRKLEKEKKYIIEIN